MSVPTLLSGVIVGGLGGYTFGSRGLSLLGDSFLLGGTGIGNPLAVGNWSSTLVASEGLGTSNERRSRGVPMLGRSEREEEVSIWLQPEVRDAAPGDMGVRLRLRMGVCAPGVGAIVIGVTGPREGLRGRTK